MPKITRNHTSNGPEWIRGANRVWRANNANCRASISHWHCSTSFGVHVAMGELPDGALARNSLTLRPFNLAEDA